MVYFSQSKTGLPFGKASTIPSLGGKEIALLELMRAPEVYVEAGWTVLVREVRDALASGEVVEGRLRIAVTGERNVVVRKNFDRLVSDLSAA